MRGRFTSEDLMKKMADGRTMFDFFVEEHIDQSEALFHTPFTMGDFEQGMALLRDLPSFVKHGAKKANVMTVLSRAILVFLLTIVDILDIILLHQADNMVTVINTSLSISIS